MVVWKAQAWVTSAVSDQAVPAALVLAESIRRTRTNFRIAVLTPLRVYQANRAAIKRAFDIVLFLEASDAPEEQLMGEQRHVLAKAYMFNLNHFDKCVYVSPNSLFLENADHIFQAHASKFQGLYSPETGRLNLSLFAVRPDQSIWNEIWKHTVASGQNITERWLCTWLQNQKATLDTGTLPLEVLTEFCVTQGKLFSNQTHSPIIHFISGDKLDSEFVMGLDVMKKLENVQMGYREKLVADEWMKINLEATKLEQECINNFARSQYSDTQHEYLQNEPIAIVGMSCRYPGANSLQEFWKLLFDGDEAIREPPSYRWTKEHTLRVSQQDRKSQAGFLSTSVDEFDARFFGVSPKEAAYMDPQTRLLHEILWESLEDAGINPLSLYGTHTGIFTGSWMNDYKDIVASSAEKDFFRTYMGNSIGAAAARLSFLLGLTGPSIATESGCSSAIVALDLAVKSLRNGETNLAMAGGVNLLLHAFNSSIMEFVISADGRCKTFDANADGFGRAEGCGVLVLKRMSDAMRDGDRVWALIRGSAISQEGLSRSMGTPTAHCESLAMKLALENAHVSPDRVSFVETHGTGTSVGDPMEVAAIAKAYFSPLRKEPLIIGSVKTNVGHTESCSGITGIMKAVLAMKHELIPKHRNLEMLNPEIFLDSIPAKIPLEAVPWPKVTGQPRLCGVSSFGITGTDGHVIIQEAPDCEMPKFTLGMERPLHLIKISGKSQEALEELLMLYENQFLQMASNTRQDLGFRNAAFSGNVGRASFSHRAFLLGRNYSDAVKMLKDRKFILGEVKDGHQPQICFLFTGQGSQYAGMAKTLYDTSPLFRINFDACDKTLRESYNLSIKQVLWESDPNSKELNRTIYSQTSIFCIEYCLLKLWQSWGIKPDYVLGHSLGEFAAAVAAEVLTFEDALRLVAERSRLIDSLPQGSMLVIKASRPEVDKHLASANIDLDFAAVNNPDQTVVAGNTLKIETFLNYLKGQGVKAIILEATHAFHSRQMNPMLDPYRKVANEINYKQGNLSVQYISGMEGRSLDNSELGADYWVRHTREKVDFINACTTLQEMGCQDFLELGPQPILSSFVMMNNQGAPLNCLPSLRRGTDEWETILTSLGKLYLLGYPVDWEGYDKPYLREKVSLPFHPFHRKSFWVECTNDNTTMIHPLIGYPMKNASTVSIFQNDLVLKNVPYLKDHCIGKRTVFPGAAFTEMCLSAGFTVANGLSETLEQPTRAITLENVRIEAPLEIKEGKACRMQVLVDLPEKDQLENSDTKSGFRVKVYHQNVNSGEETGKWVLHANSTFVPAASTKDCLARWNPKRIPEILSANQPISTDSFYKQVDEQGLRFGESFRMIQRFWSEKQENIEPPTDEVVAEMNVPADWNKYLLHPLIIDAIFQTGILTGYHYTQAKLKVPVRIGQLTMFPGMSADSLPTVLYLHCWNSSGKYYLFVSTSNNCPVCYVEDVELLDTSVHTIESVLKQQCSPIPDAWEETWKVIPSPFDSSVETAVDPAPILEHLLITPTPLEDVTLQTHTNTLLYFYILDTFSSLGWEPCVGDQIPDISAFCQKLGIRTEFNKLIHFYFSEMQKEANIMEWNDSTNTWSVLNLPPEKAVVKAEINRLQRLLENSKHNFVGRIYQRIAEKLVQILRGEESALALLFPQEPDLQQYSADCYYQNHPGRDEVMGMVGRVLKNIFANVLENNKPGSGKIYRILEVGAGTGSLTDIVLPAIAGIFGNNNLFEYFYTDISQSFFAKAETRFEAHQQSMKFAVYNIENSPLGQGIPLEYFDMVVCTDVLHATKSLEETLVHLRQTLKPGGILLFTETIIPARDITFVFGLLEGYWRFEDFHQRPHHCCVSGKVWQQLLLNAGFNFAHCVRGYADEFGIITGVAQDNLQIDKLTVQQTKTNSESDSKKEWVLFADSTSMSVHAKLASMLKACGFNVRILLSSHVDKSSQFPGQYENIPLHYVQMGIDNGFEIEAAISGERVSGIIYAWGMNQSETDQENVALPFMHLAKALVGLVKPPPLYVLTQGVIQVTDDTMISNPTSATLLGMTKSLKNENANTLVRFVDLEQGSAPELMVKHVLYELVMFRGTKEQQRVQVAYRANTRYEPKLIPSNMRMSGEEMKLPLCTERYHLVLPESRAIQDLEYEAQEEETVREAEIEVKVKAYALNFKDVLTVIKPSAEFEKLNAVGLDFAGVVTRAGPGAKFRVGERVFGANFKDVQLPSHLVIEDYAVLRIPNNMTFFEATTLPAVFLTAYHCLITVAKMKKGDTVLIHTGSGGVGLAAIQLAKHVGANIITTAGNPRKRTYLRSLGIQHVFHSRDTSYEQDILRVTNGRGVDLVLNSITGPGIKEATLRATAEKGRWVEMSKLSVWTPEEVKALRSDVEYAIVDLTVLGKQDFVRLLEHIEELLRGSTIKSIPFVKFDALLLRQAMQYLQKAKHIGKVVVSMPEVESCAGGFKTRIPLFDSNSTYLITGGLGGIGFEVCKWMFKMGATDIVLTGRNPPKLATQRHLKSLQDKGCRVTVMLGDIGNYNQCKSIVNSICSEMKPLRGVMHCAGVLKDNGYSNQSWNQFQSTFGPKVNGTWNLHQLTKDCPLEYFVMYSSLTALIGTLGQPNHAAANSFEDAFIHYRHSLGLPGTTINWGQWAQVGCAKDINVAGLKPVSVSRMLNGLEMSLRTQKGQVCYCEYESFQSFLLLSPMLKGYIDERVWKQSSNSSSQGSQAINSDQFWKEMDAEDTKPGKMTVMQSYLKIVLRSALRLEPGEALSETANLQELGVDSLMMIELKNSIQSLLGSRLCLTTGLLKDCNTIQLLANAIVSKLVESSGGQEEEVPLEPLPSHQLRQLLAKDSILPEDIKISADLAPVVQPSEIQTILVTGATGHFGKHIVARLANHHATVSRIICLVRGEQSGTEEKLKKALDSVGVDLAKVECVLGDVAQPNLGLTPDAYKALSRNVDGVVHCAAKMDQMEQIRIHCSEDKTRTDCRSVNLGGTINVLKFACAERVKHVFYPSTLITAVFSDNSNNVLSDKWPDEKEIDSLVTNKVPGLQTCKYLVERLLVQANQIGIPCKVFRFPWIAGDSQTGAVNLESMYILRFLSYLRLGAMPSVVIPANFLPADLCAQLSLSLFLRDDVPCEVFNLSHPRPQLEQEFVTLAEQEFNKKLDILDEQEFQMRLQQLSEKGMQGQMESHRIISQYFSDAGRFATGYLNSPDTFFTNQKVSTLIPGYGEDFPPTMEYLRKDLQYLKSRGLLLKL